MKIVIALYTFLTPQRDFESAAKQHFQNLSGVGFARKVGTNQKSCSARCACATAFLAFKVTK